jgi:hypothetical protein
MILVLVPLGTCAPKAYMLNEAEVSNFLRLRSENNEI